MKKNILSLIPCLLIGIFPIAAKAADVQSNQAEPAGNMQGYDFSHVIFPQLSTPEDAQYLGLTDNPESFRLFDIKADIVIIEFFSMYCPYCQNEAPQVNKLYESIREAGLQNQIKIIGIGAGNTDFEVKVFKRKYKVPFPLISDKEYKLADSLNPNEPPTPYFLIIKLLPEEKTKVLFSQSGSIGNAQEFLKMIQELKGEK